MATEHPNKILAHEPTPPYPSVFKVVFGLLTLYMIIIFISVGQNYVIGGGAH